jgi:hypothetical protein
VQPPDHAVAPSNTTSEDSTVLSNAQWERIEPLMPSSDGVKSRPFREGDDSA